MVLCYENVLSYDVNYNLTFYHCIQLDFENVIEFLIKQYYKICLYTIFNENLTILSKSPRKIFIQSKLLYLKPLETSEISKIMKLDHKYS